MNKKRHFRKAYVFAGMIIGLLIFMLCWTHFGVVKHANAEVVSLNEAETEIASEADEEKINSLVYSLISRLKAKYGEEYETYYNAVIEQWGSVEEYLLSLVNEEDATAEGWRAFVGWLNEYAPVWGSILAITAIVIVVLLGKKALNKVALFVSGTGGQFKTVFGEMNKIDKTLKAQNAALVKLLGENEKFKAEREELEKTSKEIGGDGV